MAMNYFPCCICSWSFETAHKRLCKSLSSIWFTDFLSKRSLPHVDIKIVMPDEVNLHTTQGHEGGKVGLHHLPQVSNFHVLYETVDFYYICETWKFIWIYTYLVFIYIHIVTFPWPLQVQLSIEVASVFPYLRWPI